MKVALYHPWVYLTSGIERTFVHLLERSRHDWTIYTHHHDPESTYPELAQHRVVELEPRVSVRRSLRPLVHAAATIARTRLPADGYDALLVSSEGLGDLIVTRNRLPAIAYCHTPLKIVHDPVNRAALAAKSPRHALAAAVLGPAFTAADRRLWRRFGHVFANSRETRQRIARAGLARAADVEVLHPGVDIERFRDDGRDREPFFLVAGRIMWQKNLDLAIEALRVALSAGSRSELIVAGAVDEKSRPYLSELRARARNLPVTFVVDPSDRQLIELYRSCQALLFTARNEDFGIVPLEAMAAGAPVIAVNAGGVRETVLHGRTGWLLPDESAAFAAAMRSVELQRDVLATMRPACVARAERFGWGLLVDRIDDALDHLVTGRMVAPDAVSVGSAGQDVA